MAEVVRAAIEEDADAVAVCSYQGGHNEFFGYMVDMLPGAGRGRIKRVRRRRRHHPPAEIAALEAAGVEKIYTPEDGTRLGLDGMIAGVVRRVRACARAQRASAGPR